MSRGEDLLWRHPDDEHNRRLLDHVFPESWQNPRPDRPYHLVVIGGGTAGLVTAAGAAGLGARVALIERERLGGDCLNVGCVPSKALIAAARSWGTHRQSRHGGQPMARPQVDFSAVMAGLRASRADLAPVDSAARFRDLGVDVYLGQAHFRSPGQVVVSTPDESDILLTGRRVVIATGGRPAMPTIPGLEPADYLTHETLFSLTTLPRRLAVLGGGPIGVEMAQALARLGSQVTLIERGGQLLGRESSSAAEVIANQLRSEGIEIFTQTELREGQRAATGLRLSLVTGPDNHACEVDELLVAVGRHPNVEGLQLDSIGVQHDARGIQVDDFLRTSQRTIFAAGDICSRFQFTHAADFQARIVIQNALFAIGPIGRRRASRLLIPRVTYSDPEVASIGLDIDQANEQGRAVDSYRLPMHDLDRAVVEHRTEGFLEVITRAGSDQILGATLVAPRAGELVGEIALAMQHRLGLAELARVMHPYPTWSSGLGKLGDQFNRSRLTPFSRRLLAALRWWNVGR